MRWNGNPQQLNTSPTDELPDPNQSYNHIHVKGEAAFSGAQDIVPAFFNKYNVCAAGMMLKVSILFFKSFKTLFGGGFFGMTPPSNISSSTMCFLDL